MIRIRTNRRRYHMARHPRLYRVQRWLAVLIPLAAIGYGLLKGA